MKKEILLSKNLEKIKAAFSKEGHKKIHVITDFDRTLTKSFVNGKEVPSIIAVLREENYLTQDYPKKAYSLFEKYHPIEINQKIAVKEKRKAMQEWWSKHFKLLIQSGLNKKDIERVVSSGMIKLRRGVLDFIEILHEYDIPLIILSASGLGEEPIAILLKKEGKLYKNVHIISNSFKWGKNGKAISVKKPIIHFMNKDEAQIKKFNFYNKIKERKNVILIGDSLEDIDMVKGFNYKNIIKVGFLNKNIKENLTRYKKDFDIIILNDSEKFYVDKLLAEILK
jgi:5'-nucleotidase